MASEFDPTRRLDAEIRRLMRQQLGDAAALLRAAITQVAPGAAHDLSGHGADRVERAVHLARRHCKEVRALVRLVDLDDGRGEPLDRLVRAAAHSLAPVRDAHVAAELIARTCAADGRVDARSRAAVPDAHRTAIQQAVAELELAAASTATIRVADPGALHRGLQQTYRRSRREFTRARRRSSPRRLHRWRTWNKRLWYQVRFLSVTAPSVLVPLTELLDVVGETLGDIHDLDVFVTSEPARSLDEQQRAAIADERSELRERALRWGATIHAESPSAFADRLVGLVTTAVEQGPEPTR